MNVTTSNLVDGKARRAAMVIMPMLLLPIALAGVTVRPMLEFQEASVAAKTAEHQARATASLRTELAGYESVDELERRARLLEGILDTLVPVELGSLEIYSVIRSAAAVAGLDLESLQVEEPTPFREASRGRSIGRRAVSTRASGSVAQASGFVDRLRAIGLPVAVQTYTFARRTGGAAYSVELQFDVFHHIPAAELADDRSGSMGLMETLPQ